MEPYDHSCAYREVLDAMRDLVLVKGPESRLLWPNRAFRDYYGMTEEELRDLIDGPQADPDDTLQYVQDDRTVFESGTHLNIPTEQITDAKGEIANFNTIKSPIFESGEVVRMVAVARRLADDEVFTRQVTHEDAKTLARPLRLLTSSFSLAIALVDRGGLVVSTSELWRKTFGSDAFSLGTHLLRALPQLDELADPISATLADGFSDIVQLTLDIQGEARVFVMRVGPWRYDDESIGGAMVMATDITEEARRRSELEAANQRFDLVMGGSSVGIWDRPDTEQDDEYWSDRYYEILGYEPREFPASASAFFNLLHPEDRPAIEATFTGTIEAGALYESEYRLRTKSGDYRWFRGLAKVSDSEAGKPTRMVGSVQDIDQRKRAEQKLRRVNEDLEHFVHVAAHDLREPARRQILLLDLIMEQYGDRIDDGLRKQLDRLNEQSVKMLNMVTGFRTLTGIAGPTLIIEEVDAGKLVEEILVDLAATGDEEVTVSVDLGQPVQGYPTLLDALFRNLVNNALIHGPRPLRIAIGEHVSEGQRVFTVSSTVSNGSPAQNDQKLFMPFVRNDGGEGSGLGLSICRRVIERHRGSIWIEPSEDSFDVRFTLGDQT